jgi:hypothetical protein
MKRDILLEIERSREIMGLKPLIIEGVSLLLTEGIEYEKLWNKIFTSTTEDVVEDVITKNSSLFRLGTERLEEKIASRNTRPLRIVVEEFLEKASSQEPERFINMINKLSMEIPEFATDLAIVIGENTIPYEGKKLPIYNILETWWETNGGQPNSVATFKEICDKAAEGLNIPPHTMDKLRNAAMNGNVTGLSTSGDAVVDGIIQHFGPSNYRSSTVMADELEKIISSITEKDVQDIVGDIMENGSMVLLEDGTINVNSETLIDYCLNRAPLNVRKYFRVKFKIPQTNLNISVPFINIPEKSLELVNKELKLIRGGLMTMGKNPVTYNKILEEINKHVEQKITKSVFDEIMSKYCYGSKTKGGTFGDIANYFRKEALGSTTGFKGFCNVVRYLLMVEAIHFLIVTLDLPIGQAVQMGGRVIVQDFPDIVREVWKDARGLLTEDDTDLIEEFYVQHPESKTPDNTRFTGEYKGGYFEVKINETNNGLYGLEQTLSDWKIVKYINGSFKLEDSKSWWDKTKEKATEKAQDIKQGVDSLKQQ